jgi:Fic family protein
MKIEDIAVNADTDICRLNLTRDEYQLLIKMINNLNIEDDDFEEDGRFEGFGFCIESLMKKVQNVKQIKITNKRAATTNANEKKISTSLKKVENAINLLRLEDKEITAYAVAKVAGISYNTASKYLKMINDLK